MNLPGQLIIDALNTATPTARSWPPVNRALIPCILLHCIYIYSREMNAPGQLIIDALNTATPTARSRPPVN